MSTAVSIDSGGSAAGSIPALGAPSRTRARSRWWLELLTIGWLCWLYDLLTNMAPLRLSSALAHAGGVLHVEQVMHLDPELGLDRWLAGHPTVGLVVSDYYDNAHFIVTLAILGWLWWRRADLYRPLRNALVLTNLMAFVVFWLYPVAPPRMLPGFTDVVASTHALGSWHTGALASHADELAAMPSLHMAWAAWCALALWLGSTRRWVRAAGLLYPCLTAFAVLTTGNHFVLDIAAGLATLALAALCAFPAERLRAVAAAGLRVSEWRLAARRLVQTLAGGSSTDRPARVPHVTNLLRSPGPSRLAPPPRTAHGVPAADCAWGFSSVGWPYRHARLRLQRRRITHARRRARRLSRAL